jgi:excisionase family DNA binding protein
MPSQSGASRPALYERWASVEEVCAHLGVARDTVYRWIAAKRIPAHRLGRLWKFKISEVDRWVRTESPEPRE